MVNYSLWKIVAVLAVCVLGVLYALPNVLPSGPVERWAQATPDWVPGRTVNLGLDLRGGSHLLLEVETDVALEERIESLVDTMRSSLRDAEIGYTRLGTTENGKAAQVVLRSDADPTKAHKRLADAIGRGIEIQRDGRTFTLRLSDQAAAREQRETLQQAIEVVRRRINQTGMRDPTIQAQGAERIIVQLPGVDNPGRIKEILGRTARLTFHLVDTDTSVQAARNGNLPPGSKLVPAADPQEGRPEAYVIERRAPVTGERLEDAQATFQQGQPVVRFRFDSVGAKIFGDLTANNVGKPFAVVLDGKVISAPRINEPIPGGTGIIEGNFTAKEAQNLALLLRAGALPAPIKVVSQRTVGPSLGQDSIEAGRIAAAVALVAVMVFMVWSYGRFGAMADAGLLVNLVLLMGALSLLQATLTLPGIAGIVLTVGMAVDANVLIFERIREETQQGRTVISAIDAGYRNALGTIIDANVTTLIAAVLLYIFGSGPIRGFAITLSLGILTSMFTAIMVTRLLVVLWLRRRRPRELAI